ncbi:bifunctional adenosylcobinamide kinase/adenosylcobinamide-phosphate guanylyltransferase [Yinghuangia sp. YIM S09857]|uniref:bifunctional adenosylcobinamide kinase/adenosylcobinamide-phosphate guanylyltransferase n=1 Tax=Yinghuangia sp. YIM S09857 TaxID=3436929 RepID=UPI003F532774
MELTFLGTAGPRGWPQPFCTCASCLGCTGSAVREPSCVLVDGTLLIDCGPEPAHAAARAARPLTGVRHLLLSGPAESASLNWLPAAGLDVVAAPSGPPPGLPAPTAGGPPWQTVEPGEEFVLGSHLVRVLPGGSPGRVAYAVTGPGGARLLYIPSSLLAPEADAAPAWADGRPYDAVLLDVVAWPERLAALRREGAVTEETDVLAVHLSHEAPPGEELQRRLAAWGARAVSDGGVVRLGADPDRQPVRPHRTLILGGARSGKSAEAERRLSAVPDVVYVATGGTREGDAEWAERVAAHRDRRPASWKTVESTDLTGLIGSATGPLLIDCLSLWLTAVMDECGAWDDEAWDDGARDAVRARVAELAAAWRACRAPLVAVSNEVGSGVVPPTPSGRRYRDELGRLNAAIADESDEVLLVVAGLSLTLRGLPRKPRHARS